MHRLIALAFGSLLMAAPLAAQTPAPANTPPAMPVLDGQQTPPPPPAAPKAQTAPPATPPAPASPGQHGTPEAAPPMVNVRIELAISETVGGNAPIRKTVVLITGNGSRGSVRSTMARPGYTMGLNVDAWPHVQRDGRISVSVTFQYSPEASQAQGAPSVDRPADLNETMEVYLMDGKPLVLSQSADPVGDRKVTVEVTATVLK